MGVTREQTRRLAPRTGYGNGPNGGHAGNTAARILVVDDEASNVEALIRILNRAGFRHVKGTTDSRSVLQLLEDHNPDLILLDLHMPNMDGFAVLTQLRAAIPSDCYLPILMLTAADSAQMRQRALAMGAKDFLGKPFDVPEVLLRIRNLIETRTLHLALQSQNQSLERRVPSAPPRWSALRSKSWSAWRPLRSSGTTRPGGTPSGLPRWRAPSQSIWAWERPSPA